MKKTTIILISAILSVHSISVAQDTEIQPYEVIKAIDSVEIDSLSKILRSVATQWMAQTGLTSDGDEHG